MKTVMKKMFSLLLVAVLLVGVMPFQAFAATEVTIEITLNGNSYGYITKDQPTAGGAPLSSWINDAKAALPEKAQAYANCSGLIGSSGNPINADEVVNGWTVFANFTSPYCDTCNSYSHNKSDGHCDSCGWGNGTGHGATCTRNCNMGFNCPSDNHKAGCKYNICETCGNEKHGTIPCCGVCDTVNGHALDCKSGCTGDAGCNWGYAHVDNCESQNVCETCGETGHFAKNCPQTICPDCGAAVANKKHEPGCIELCNGKRNCPNEDVVGGHHKTDCDYALCDTEDCELNEGHSGVHKGAPCTDENCDYSLGHSGKHSYQCPEDGCDKAVGHDGKHSNEPNYASGSHKLKVYARIWVHETKFETRLLDTITDLSGDAKIYQVIAANKDHLNAILPYDEFKALHWGETVNYLDDDKDYKDVGTRMTVGDENEVYVNLYSAEQLIVVNVHTNKTWAYDLSVRIEGFRPGDLVEYEDVLKAVKKYYNVSSLKMFTYEEMCDYLDGGKADETKNFIAGEREDPYEVFISGSRKSGAYKYTADSTNPKTGDEIFVPMAVLGLSASALAVMFYLNKKRAY